jgi:cell division protein FtsQ
MWDNPRALNAAAGFLVGVALLAFALAALALALRSPLFALRVVEVRTPLNHVARGDLEAAIAAHTQGNFFGAGIGELRAALEALAWVRKVEVRRVWPDRLEITIEEHQALARWGEDALVNTYGERFTGRAGAELPLFVGPRGSEAKITRWYARFGATVVPLGAALERVTLTPRYAWHLRLANGLELALGRDAELAEQRLTRFVELYRATLAGRRPSHEYVDLRYPNGFAVRGKGSG